MQVVVHEVSRLCTDARLKTPAMLGQLVLNAVMDSPVCRMQTCAHYLTLPNASQSPAGLCQCLWAPNAMSRSLHLS